MAEVAPLLLAFPFRGRWMAQNSPADRVPSHGTHLFGTTYAIDFVAVDERGRTAPRGPFVLVAHLRRGSILVRPGDSVRVGDLLGACGNSGNSTEPHVHLQATDGIDQASARGIPIAFRSDTSTRSWLPRNGEPFAVD